MFIGSGKKEVNRHLWDLGQVLALSADRNDWLLFADAVPSNEDVTLSVTDGRG